MRRMKAGTHDTDGKVQYGDHWGNPVRMELGGNRDENAHLDELGHKFPVTLRKFLHWDAF